MSLGQGGFLILCLSSLIGSNGERPITPSTRRYNWIMGVRYYLHIVVVAARERARPPRQVGPPVLLRPRLREPPAVVDAVTAREMACKTQAARRARAEALASRAGAMLTHDFLELDASRSASHPSAVRPRGKLGRLFRRGSVGFGVIRVIECRLNQLTK